MTLELRFLEPTPATLADVQRVAEACPAYYRAIRGGPAPASEAADTFDFTDLPPGIDPANVFFFGLHHHGRMVGVANMTRGYKAPDAAWLGWLIIEETLQGQGLGRQAYGLLEAHARQWPDVRRMQLAVVRTNTTAFPFWARMGFTDTGARKPWNEGSVESESHILEKRLANSQARFLPSQE